MSMAINTNITSMIGQQNLSESKSALTTSMERLSSGLRINSAKDDAAGQAIANRMSSQITGLSQAQRNANDGISVAQTAEGALNQVNDNLQRVRELAVQAENGTNSDKDLTSIQDEINQRLGEIDRISNQTDFNGTKVLAEDGGLKVQVGANDGEAITVNLKEINAKTLGLEGFNVDGTGAENSSADVQSLLANGFAETATPGEYQATGFNKKSSVEDVFSNLENGATIKDLAAGGSTYTLDAESNTFSFDRAAVDVTDSSQAASDLGLTPKAGESNTVTVKLGGAETQVNISSSGTLTNAETGENLYLTGSAGTKDLSETSQGGSQATIDDLVTELAAIDGSSAASGSITTSEGTVYKNSAGDTAKTIATENESIEFEALQNQIKNDTSDSYDIDLDGKGASTGDQYNINSASSNAVTDQFTAGAGTAVYTSGFSGDNGLSGNADATVYLNDNGKITDGAANEIFTTEDGKLTKDAVSDATVTEDPLATLDNALNQVDSLRSELGAVQNRFESAITNLSTNETNLSAARSRIEDADYATEVANMTKNQILQQAGTSVLAQANQLPQSVLSLLG